MFNKNTLRKYTIIGDKQLQKKERDHFEQRSVACVVGKNDKRALYIPSSEFCQLDRNLFGIRATLKESIFMSNNQVNSTVTTRT